ncbi:hypothetical protein BH09PAT3_BH09PAT3_6750 [soil metagenome]
MTDPKVIQQQLRDLKFGNSAWNQAELRELPKIIHEGEKISECVNGFYEGGVALLVATEMRVLLIDKKPMRFLNVEDLRFDMINEIDYAHRLMGATVTITTGTKALKFNSYNQKRRRNLIGLVQEHMSNGKKEQSQKADSQQQHLQEINNQLQMYLMAQHQQLQQQLQQSQQQQIAAPQLPKPNPQLSDYLFAQRLLEQFQREKGNNKSTPQAPQSAVPPQTTLPADQTEPTSQPIVDPSELVAEAKREVFGRNATAAVATKPPKNAEPSQPIDDPTNFFTGLEVSPLRIAYSKLPMMLRNRKFGRPSFHAHSQQQTVPTGQTVTP